MNYSDIRKKHGIGISEEEESQEGGNTYFDIRKKHGISYDDVGAEYVSKLVNDYKTWVEGFQSDYDGRSYKNASDLSSRYSSSASDLRYRAGRVNQFLNIHKDSIDAEAYNSLDAFIKDVESSSRNIEKAFLGYADVVSKYKTEEEFKEALAARAAWDDYANYDFEVGNAKIKGLEAQKSKYEKERDEYFANDYYITDVSPESYKLDTQYATEEDAREAARLSVSARVSTAYGTLIRDVEAEIDAEKQRMKKAGHVQDEIRLSAVADPESEHYDPEIEKITFKLKLGGPNDWFWRNHLDGGLAKYMEPEEEKILTYWTIKDNDEAVTYFKAIESRLEARQTQSDREWYSNFAKEWPITSSIYSVFTSLGSGVEYLADIFDYAVTGEMGQNRLADITNTIRGTVSENVNWKIGNWDAFDFVYNTAMSGVDSVVVGTMLGPAGGTVLGLSAAAQGTNDALDRGMSNSQAFWSGFVSGVFEGVFETWSIGKLDALKTGKLDDLKHIGGMGRYYAKNIGKSMLVNLEEEGATELANIAYDIIVNGDLSHYAINVRKYMEEGMSESEAKRKAAIDQGLQVAEAMGSGALMGFGFGAAGSVSNARGSYKAGKSIIADGKVDNLVDLGKTFSPDSDVYKFAEGINGDSSALSVGRLLKGVQGELSAQNVADIQDALVERGVSEQEAAKLAEWMNKVVNGGTLSKSQQAALENNPVLAEVLYGTIMSSDSSVMKRGSLYNQLFDIASSMGVERQALEAQQPPEAITQRMNDRRAFGEPLRRGANSRMGLSEADIAQIDEVAAKIRESSAPASAKIADVADKVSDTGETIVKSTNEEVSIKKIASIDTKKKTMKLELSNGKVVDSKDISYGDEKQAALYESVLLMGYDAHTANAIVSGYTANNVANINDYLLGTNTAFNYGWSHVPEKARKGVGYDALTPTQKEHFVKLGENARAADDEAREARAAQKQSRVAKKKPKDAYGARVSEEVNTSKLSPRAKESVKALDAVAKALKINIVVADLNGNSYGFYNPATNELFVDKNAGGRGKDTLLFTASHELVHYIRNWSPAKFTILADFLIEQYAAKGENIDALIKAEIDKAYRATRGKHQMTYDEAYEEVVAQAMQRFLTDSNFIERLAALQKKDANLAKRLVSKLKELLDKIRSAYRDVDTRDRASQAVKEMGKAIDELYAKMEEALIAASEVSQGIGARNFEDFSEAKNTDGKELFQYKAMEADEDTYRQMLKKHGIMSEAEINNLFSTIDKALVIIKNNLEVLDYAWEVDIDDRSFSPVKPNSDSLYKVSLDFSTLCRKRILQQIIQTQLQDALNKPLSREESVAIRDELIKIQEEGRQIEIACALCYVEAARMKSPAQIKKFLKNRDGIIKEFLASKSGGDAKQKIKQAEIDARERLHKENPKGIIGKNGVVLDPRSATLKSMTKAYADEIRLAKRQAKQAYTPTAEEQKLIDAALSMTVTDFTSPEGLENLAKNYPVLFDAYTSFVRNATKSKGIEKDTWWRAGDSNSIGDTLIANMNRENGLRSQSWSDFQVIHLLDYIAATIELSTRNAKEQAYSKVPDFIELMGNTGAMLNMSLIPMAKFNGKLEYDSVEGMAYKRALELREKYHATAGTICIGITNDQIKMLLADGTIDYVIPYHKSGMAAEIRKLMHIPKWDDYESYQNETNLDRDEAKKQAKKYGVTLLSESDPNYHKHTAFSEWFDIEEAKQIAKQENAFPTDAKLQKKYGVMHGGYMAMQNAANNYLKLCAERGIAPKFSHENANFATQENYWKLLIDRKMVDNVTGEIIEQQTIKPIFDESEILRILNDELERYPGVKADQDYATRTVVEKFLSGKMNDRLDPDTVAAIMQKPVDNITTTNIVASEEGIKAQYADKSFSGRYSYEELTSKPDMKLTSVGGAIPNNRADIIVAAKKNAAKIGNFNPKDGSVSVHIKDVGEDVVISTGGLRHSLDRRFDVNAPVAVKAGEILQNSIKVNEMTPKNANADSSYVLIGAARNDKGELYIVRSVVNRFKSELVSMDVLYAINAKTEPNLGIKKGNQVGAYPQGSLPNDSFLTDSTISISQLLDFVNKYFPDILPESVLRHYGYDARPDGDLGENVLYQYADTDSDGNKLSEGQQEYFKYSVVRDEQGRLLAVYHGTQSGGFHIFENTNDIGYFFTNSLDVASTYSGSFNAYDAKKITTWDEAIKAARSVGINVSYFKSSNTYMVDDYSGSFENWKAEDLDKFVEKISKKLKVPSSTNYKVFLNLEKPLIVNGNGDNWFEVANHDADGNVISEAKKTKDWVKEAVEKGYDGVIFKNIYDGGKFGSGGKSDVYVALRQDQIKSVNNTNPTSDPDIRYQYKGDESIDNRELLANALEGAAQTPEEKQKLKEYKSMVSAINAEEKKLRELRAQIKEISFSKGPRDTAKLKKLQSDANRIANRINRYDKKLLSPEVTEPLKNVLQREKDLLRKKMMQKQREAVKAVKERDMATMREITERYTESRKKAVEGRNKTQMRHKIKGVVGELNQLLLNGTKDKHVMIGLQKAVASALDAVNMDTVGADERVAKYDALIAKAKDPDVIASLQETRDRIKLQGDNMNEKLTALKNAYNGIKNSKDPLIANSHDEVIENKIESVVNSIGETQLRDMTLEQLEDVYDMYKMVLTTIRNSNKAFKMDKAESIASLGNNVMGEIESIAGSKEYTAKILEGVKKFGWNSLKPTQAFEAIGSGTFKKVFANVRAGEDTWAVDINEAREYYREKSKRYKYDSWDLERQYDFLSKTGKTFRLSLEQIMSLYAYSKRKQADLHLEQGGFVFDSNIETHKETVVETKEGEKVKKSILKYVVNTARAYSISKEALADIVGKLTDEQKAFVDEMQTYLSEVMGEKGNEVSLEMYGVKLFKEKHYFPLKSAKQFMFEQNEVAGEVRIKNSGFSKDTVPNANNPIILSNFMDVWAKHVNDMSMYHAFVLPLEDFNRVFNYKTPTDDKSDTESVKMYLHNAYGKHPGEYIKQLITDLNGGVRVDPNSGFVNKGIALFKKGAVFASASVMIQQPSAIARAFAYIDPKYFATKPRLSKHSIDWEECKQYAPVARIKEMGYFDTNVGMQTTEWITAKEYKGFKEKIKGLKDSNYRDEVLSKAPALADELAWTHIWNAVKKEVATTTNLEVGSETFLKRAGERFTEVIVNTQVYDSVLSRSGLMRSKDTGMKMATAFMAEPITSLNMIVNSFVQAKRGNKKFARKIVGSVASSIILNSLLVSLVYAARDDDEDETYLEKYLGSLTSELIDGFNPITYIPFAKDIWSIAQGYDVERSDMSVYSKLWQSFEELFDENKSAKDKVLDFSGSVATMFGFPLKNITRDVEALFNLATNDLGIEDTTAAGIGYSTTDALRNSIPLLGRFYEEDTKAEKLYDAFMSGNKTQIARAKSAYADEEAATTAMKNEVKKRLLSGEIDARTATNHLINYCDLSSEEVYWVIDKWDYEAENGSTEDYSKRDTLYGAILSGNKAEIEGATSGYKDEDAVESAMRSEIKERYLSGDIDYGTASEYLEDYGDMESEDVYWKMREWDYEKEHGTSEGYAKYGDFHEAVRTGKNIKAIIKEYTSHGVTKKTLASQITSHFKPLYIEMSRYERAGIKGYLLNAYVLLGYNRTEKSKDIDKWLEE